MLIGKSLPRRGVSLLTSTG